MKRDKAVTPDKNAVDPGGDLGPPVQQPAGEAPLDRPQPGPRPSTPPGASQDRADRWRALTESAVDAIITSDRHGLIGDWNRGAEVIFGYPKAEVVGRPITDLMPARYQAAHNHGMERFLRTGEAHVMGHTAELHGVRKSGEEFPLELSLSWWRTGGEVYYTAIIRDITERKRAEQALLRQAELVRLLQEVATTANEATSLDEVLRYTVERVCRYTGWPVGHVYVSANDARELTPSAIWHTSDAVRFQPFREVSEQARFGPGEGLPGRVLATGAPAWIEDVLKDPGFSRAKMVQDLGIRSGFAFPVLIGREVAAVLEFYAEQPTPPDASLLETMANIGTQLGRVAERQRAQERLRERERQLARAQEIAHLGSWEWNVQAGALTWSDELYRIYGLAPGSPISFEAYQAMIPAEDREAAQQVIGHAAETGEPFSLYHRIVRPDGTERIVRGEGEVIRDEAGTLLRMYGTAHDVTEMRRTEEALRRRDAQNRALISALPDVLMRLDAKGTFLDYIEPRGFKTALPPETFLGKTVHEVLRPELADLTLQRIRRALEDGETQVFEYDLEVRGVTRYREARIVRVGADEVLAIMRDVTERRQVQMALLESEERFRVLSEASFEAIFVTDKGIVRDANGRAPELFGYAGVEEMIGMNALDLVAPESVEKVRDMMGGNLAELYEAVLRRKDGSSLLAEVQGRKIVFNGQSARVTAVRDVTERARAAQAIRERERQLARAQEIAHLGSWEWNVQTGALTWSDELYRIYGLAPEGGTSYEQYLSMVHPDDRARIVGCIETTLRTGEPFTFEERIIRPNGDERVLRTTGERIMDEDGTTRLTGVCHDITEARRAEQDLRENERRFRLLAENMSDLVTLHQPDGRYLYVSPSSKRLLGYEPEELIGRDPYDLMHPDDVVRVREGAHREILSGDVRLVTTLRLQRRTGEYVWVEAAAKSILNEEGEVELLQTSARDVNERVLAEQALERTNLALQQRNRELQDFAYVASHDLQEPLRKINAFADLLQEEYADRVDETGRHYLVRMQDSAARMSTLLQDLLAFSRVTTKAKPFTAVDLGVVVENVRSDLEIMLGERGGTLEAAELPTLEADASQMHQLLQNLIGNALKFTREGVPPVVRVAAAIERAQPLAGRPDVLELSVEDNGIGFDEKYLDRIFTPFQRLHARERFPGTGMGLAICRRIVERHHGSITARSVPGEGSCFIVRLPLQQGDAAAV